MKYLRQGLEGEKLQEKKQLLKKAWDNFKDSGIVSYNEKKIDDFIDWHDGVKYDDLVLYGKSLIDDVIEQLHKESTSTNTGETFFDITSLEPYIAQLEILGVKENMIAPFVVQGNKSNILEALISPLTGENLLGKDVQLLFLQFNTVDARIEEIKELGWDTYLIGLENKDEKYIRERSSHEDIGYVNSYSIIDEKYILFIDLDYSTEWKIYDMETKEFLDIEQSKKSLKIIHPLTGKEVHYIVENMDFVKFGEDTTQEEQEKKPVINSGFHLFKELQSFFDGISGITFPYSSQLLFLEESLGEGKELYVNLVSRNHDLSEIAIVDSNLFTVEYMGINDPLSYSGSSVYGFTYSDSPLMNLQNKGDIRNYGLRNFKTKNSNHIATGDLFAPTGIISSEEDLANKRKQLLSFYRDSGLLLASEHSGSGRHCLFNESSTEIIYLISGDDYQYHADQNMLQILSEDTRGFYTLSGDEVAIADSGPYSFTGKGKNLLYEKKGSLVEVSIEDKKILKTYKKWKEEDGFIFIDLPFSFLKMVTGKKSQRVIELKTGIEF